MADAQRQEIVRLVDGLVRSAGGENADADEVAAWAAELLKIALCDLNRIADALEKTSNAQA